MEYVQLKNSDINVSRLCMGCCQLGQHGWGVVKEQDLICTVSCAVDSGINFFDTADTYGLGKSEETLAKALDDKRYGVIIATKFGVRVESGKTYYDNSPEWIETALAGSLRRLNRDYVDLYQIHYRDNVTPLDAIIDVLEKLKEKGLIRCYGFSNARDGDILGLKPYAGKFASMQNEYSLACRDNESILTTVASELDVTPMTWGSLGQGILTGKYDKDVIFSDDDRRNRDVYINFHGEKLLKNLNIVEAMKPIAEKHRVSLSAVAVRFILDNLADSVILVGAKRSSQITDNIGAMNWTLEDYEINELCNVSEG